MLKIKISRRLSYILSYILIIGVFLPYILTHKEDYFFPIGLVVVALFMLLSFGRNGRNLKSIKDYSDAFLIEEFKRRFPNNRN